jgi:hypothetical protein
VAAPHVPGVAGLVVEPAEREPVDVDVEAAEPGLQVRLGDRRVDLLGGVVGDALMRARWS